MKKRLGVLLVSAAMSAAIAVPADAANIVYHGTSTLKGINIDFRIETNGATGNLALSDIVGSTITFSGTSASRYGAFSPYTAVNRLWFSNENGFDTLLATDDDLSFDFAHGGNLNFDFNDFLDADGNRQSFAYALAGRGVTDGDAVVYGHGDMATREIDDAREYANLTEGTYDEVNFDVEPAVQVIATAETVAAVPEPATWAMMLVGFGMVGGAARYRRRATKIAYA